MIVLDCCRILVEYQNVKTYPSTCEGQMMSLIWSLHLLMLDDFTTYGLLCCQIMISHCLPCLQTLPSLQLRSNIRFHYIVLKMRKPYLVLESLLYQPHLHQQKYMCINILYVLRSIRYTEHVHICLSVICWR